MYFILPIVLPRLKTLPSLMTPSGGAQKRREHILILEEPGYLIFS